MKTKKNKYNLVYTCAFLITINILPTKDTSANTLCQYTQNTNSIQEEFIKECSNNRNTELVASNLMRKEVDFFHDHTIDQVFQDNQSHPQSLVPITIHALRSHNTCLQEICFSVFQQCNPQNISLSNTDAAKRWCQQKTSELFEVGKQKVMFSIDQNYARKERSLHRQKHNALSSRFNAYTQHWLNEKVVPSLTQFAKKVALFVRYPF